MTDASVGRVFMLDATNGAILHIEGAGFDTPLAVAVDVPARRVIVVSDSSSSYGDISVLDADSGRLLQNSLVDGSLNSVVVDERRGRAYATDTGANQLIVVDATSGDVLDTIYVAANAAALDESSGRLYVASVAPPGTDVADHYGNVATPAVLPPGNVTGAISEIDPATDGVVESVTVDTARTDLRALAVDQRTHRLYAAYDGGLTILDAHLAIIGTVAMGGDGIGDPPTSVVPDEESGRIFVTSWNNGIEDATLGSSGEVTALDALTGLALGSFATGPMPAMAVVDAPAGEENARRQRRQRDLSQRDSRRDDAGAAPDAGRATSRPTVAADSPFARRAIASRALSWPSGAATAAGIPSATRRPNSSSSMGAQCSYRSLPALHGQWRRHAGALGRALTAQRGSSAVRRSRRRPPASTLPPRVTASPVPSWPSGAHATEWSYWARRSRRWSLKATATARIGAIRCSGLRTDA